MGWPDCLSRNSTTTWSKQTLGPKSWTMVSAILPSLSSSFRRCCVSASWRFRESASAPPAEATFLRRSSDCFSRESRVVDADCACTSKRSARELSAMQELTLQAQTAAQTRDFRSQLTSFLARTAAGNAQIDRREHSGRAEHENSREQPEAAFAKRAAQQLEDDIREMLSLHGVLEQGLELFLWLTLAELRPNPGGKFHRFEGKRDYVIGAEIQGASTLHGAALNDHHDLERQLRLRAGLELGDQSTAAQVRRRCFGDQHFGRQCLDLVDGQAVMCSDVIPLA